MKLKLFHYLNGVIVALLCLPLITYADDLAVRVNHASSNNSNDGSIEVLIRNVSPPYDVELLDSDGETVLREYEDVVAADVGFYGLEDGDYCIRVIKYGNEQTCEAGKCVEVLTDNHPNATNPYFTYQSDGCDIDFTNLSTGEIFGWEWNFGDGAQNYTIEPWHTYAFSGNYWVVLTVTDGNGKTNSYFEQITVDCNGLGGGTEEGSFGSVDCYISGPSTIALGETITITASGLDGFPPYDYEWILPDELGFQVLFGAGPHTISIPDNAQLFNGDVLRFRVETSDATGDYSFCELEVTIQGGSPGIDLVIFGQTDANDMFFQNGYMVFVAFPEIWQFLTNECYQFSFYHYGPGGILELIEQTNCMDGDYDYDGITFSEEGYYRACVRVSDGIYSVMDCEDFVIGNPGPLPPANPAFVIEHDTEQGWEEDAFELESCGTKGLRLNSGTSSISALMDATAFVLVKKHGTDNFDFETDVYSSYTIEENNGNVINTSIDGRDFQINNCYDVMIVACFDNDNCTINDNAIAEYSCLFTVTGSEVQAAPFELITEDCIPELLIEPTCGVELADDFPYIYEWKAYRYDNENDVIDGLLMNPTTKNPSINMEHSYFDEFDTEAFFYAEVIVTDAYGHKIQQKRYLSINAPLRIVAEAEQFRCEGATVPLVIGTIAEGGTGIYTYEWSGPNGFTSTEANPQIVAPSSGTVTYTLEVTSGACSVSRDITVETSNLHLDFPITDYRCNSDFILEIGPENVDDLGGSGHYEIEWSVRSEAGWLPIEEYLDNPFILRPKVINYIIDDEDHLLFILTVKDVFGGCATQGDVRVRYLNNPQLFAEAHEDDFINVCFGEPFSLGSTINASHPNALISWTSNHPYFNESDEPVLNLSEIYSQSPGSYQFEVTVENSTKGCAIKDEVEVTIGKPWVYEGFNSNTIALELPVDLQEAWTTGTNEIYTTDENSNSGAIGPFAYEWLTDFTTVEHDVVAGNGYLRQSKFDPLLNNFHIVRTTDLGTGCSKDFKTDEYLVFGDTKPTGSIQNDVSPDGDCDNFPGCFELEVDLDYRGNGNLPSSLSVGVKIVGTNNGGGVIINETKVVNLGISNPETGTYKGTFCLTPNELTMDGSYSIHLLFSSGVIEGIDMNSWYPEHFLNPLELDKILFVYQSTVFNIVPAFACPPFNNFSEPYSLKGIEVVAPGYFFANCAIGDIIVHEEATNVEFVGGPEGRVFLRTGFHAQAGSEFHAYINPCFILDDNLTVEDTIQEREEVAFDKEDLQEEAISQSELILYPNPFNQLLQISYSIKTEAPAKVSLQLMDVSGRIVATLIDSEWRETGNYHLEYNTSKLPSGLYFYELLVNNKKITKKAVKIDR